MVDVPEPPLSQPANSVELKIAAKSDFLYLNFLFIINKIEYLLG